MLKGEEGSVLFLSVFFSFANEQVIYYEWVMQILSRTGLPGLRYHSFCDLRFLLTSNRISAGDFVLGSERHVYSVNQYRTHSRSVSTRAQWRHGTRKLYYCSTVYEA